MKTRSQPPKRQGGISLRPELWERIDEAARIAGVPRNQVMETALMERFGLESNFRKMHTKKRDTEEDDLPTLEEDE
jgi:hypothetical protein